MPLDDIAWALMMLFFIAEINAVYHRNLYDSKTFRVGTVVYIFITRLKKCDIHLSRAFVGRFLANLLYLSLPS
jgi:uncharacterized MnhB-related membrane protein